MKQEKDGGCGRLGALLKPSKERDFGSVDPPLPSGGTRGALRPAVCSQVCWVDVLASGEGLSPSPIPFLLSGHCKPHIPRNLTAAPPPGGWPASTGKAHTTSLQNSAGSSCATCTLASTMRSSSEAPSQTGEEKPKGARPPRDPTANAPKSSTTWGNNVNWRKDSALRPWSDVQSVFGWTFLPQTSQDGGGLLQAHDRRGGSHQPGKTMRLVQTAGR